MNHELVFGQIPLKEAEHRRRSEAARRKPPENQEIYDAWKMLPLIEEVTRSGEEEWRHRKEDQDELRKKIFEKVWGTEAKAHDYLSPSTLSLCFRWVGYEKLGYQRAALQPEEIWRMWMGTGFHYRILRELEQKTEGKAEVGLIDEKAKISGRADFLIRNPLTEKWHIIEIKTTGPFGFRQRNRRDLPREMTNTKGIYQLSKIHFRQTGLYLHCLEKEGKEPDGASIVYFQRGDRVQAREGIMVWDPQTKFRVAELIEAAKIAHEKIKKGQLPEPTAEDAFICRSFCPFRNCCDCRQEIEKGQVKYQKKRLPKGIRLKQREYQAKTRQTMIELGLVQAQLSGFEEVPTRKSRKKTKSLEKKEGPACGDCGGPTKWNLKAARGGKWVCDSIGCSAYRQ